MKFKCTLSSMGVTWLERFVPIFDKMGKELSVLFTPETLHLVQGAADSGGLDQQAISCHPTLTLLWGSKVRLFPNSDSLQLSYI